MLSTFIIILCFTLLVFLLGVGLSLAAHKFNVTPKDPMQHLVEKCLPGVQCGQCGYVGCAEYANAIILENAPINLCTPGGDTTIKAIADVMNCPIPESKDSALDEEKLAFIDKTKCIGCGKCAKICPYDAIEGKIKSPYEVQKQYCTGCQKCVESCPTKCITMQLVAPTTDTWHWQISNKTEEKKDE